MQLPHEVLLQAHRLQLCLDVHSFQDVEVTTIPTARQDLEVACNVGADLSDALRSRLKMLKDG